MVCIPAGSADGRDGIPSGDASGSRRAESVPGDIAQADLNVVLLGQSGVPPASRHFYNVSYSLIFMNLSY